MSVKGTAERGRTLVYRIPFEGVLRFTNLTDEEVEDTIRELGEPDRVCDSRLRS